MGISLLFIFSKMNIFQKIPRTHIYFSYHMASHDNGKTIKIRTARYSFSAINFTQRMSWSSIYLDGDPHITSFARTGVNNSMTHYQSINRILTSDMFLNCHLYIMYSVFNVRFLSYGFSFRNTIAMSY